MELLNIIFRKKYKVLWISTFVLILIYVVLRLFIFDSDPIIPLLSSLANSYLLLIEKFANQLLHYFGSTVTIENHTVMLNYERLDGFIPEIRLTKWMALFLFLVFITKTSFGKRILFSFLLILIHFLVVSVYIAVGAFLSGFNDPNYSFLSIPITLGLLVMVTILLYWFKRHKEAILNSLSKLKINTKLFENGYRVMIIIYIYIILSSFLFEFFEFRLWIDFLFISAQKILTLMGYEAVVEPFYLIGANGSISMIKGCLGFQTMLLFAVMVFLTGIRNKYRWIYTFAGLIFLNVVNIFRFVFLFIHIQKHGDYILAMDVHDMYNYITYFIVFILWIIWFEKFAESPSESQKKDEAKNEILK